MESYNRLLEHNIKPSMQRIAIMNYLMEHKTHPSADEIYTELSPSMPTISASEFFRISRIPSLNQHGLPINFLSSSLISILASFSVTKGF